MYIAPQDYVPRNRSLFIPRSIDSFRFSIIIIDDRLLEQDEQFGVLLHLPTNGLRCGITLGSIATATVTIIDNDGMYVGLICTVFYACIISLYS